MSYLAGGVLDMLVGERTPIRRGDHATIRAASPLLATGITRHWVALPQSWAHCALQWVPRVCVIAQEHTHTKRERARESARARERERESERARERASERDRKRERQSARARDRATQGWKEEEEEEEEESLFKADAVNEEDSERDRATQV